MDQGERETDPGEDEIGQSNADQSGNIGQSSAAACPRGNRTLIRTVEVTGYSFSLCAESLARRSINRIGFGRLLLHLPRDLLHRRYRPSAGHE
jgi:hypothetical protein